MSVIVIIYRLGGAEDFRGGQLIFGWKKGGSFVTENPKGGIAENFGRIQRGGGGPLKFTWKMNTCEGGSRKSSKVIRGHHFSEVAFNGWIG